MPREPASRRDTTRGRRPRRHPDRAGRRPANGAHALALLCARGGAGQARSWSARRSGWRLPACWKRSGRCSARSSSTSYLLPRTLDWRDDRAAARLACLLAGCAASVLRYFQLVRLAGLAMRSVRRLREGVYTHVLRLPMAFLRPGHHRPAGQPHHQRHRSRSSSCTCRCCSRCSQASSVLVGAVDRHGLARLAADADRADAAARDGR